MEYPLHLTLKSGRINDIATRWIKDSLEELQDSHFRIKSSKTENDFVGGGPPSFLIMTSFRLLRRVTGASHAAGVKFNSRGQVAAGKRANLVNAIYRGRCPRLLNLFPSGIRRIYHVTAPVENLYNQGTLGAP